MKSLRNKLIRYARYFCLAGVIALGLITTLATHNGDSSTLPPGAVITGLHGTPGALFYNLNASTGASTRVAGFGLGNFAGILGVTGIEGLAFDPNTNTLYGFDSATLQLIAINVGTGAGVVRGGPLGILGAVVSGLTFDAITNILYGSDTGNTNLVTINTGTGAGVVVGPLGFFSVQGLAFAPNTIFGSNDANGIDGNPQLLTINTATGAGTAIGTFGFPGVVALAADPDTNTIYGVDGGNQLLTIDTATGTATAAGALLGFPLVTGLTYDSGNNILYGTDSTAGNGQLLTIDPATGAGTAVGPTGDLMLGLAFL